MLNVLPLELLRLVVILLSGYLISDWLLIQAFFGLLVGFLILCFWYARQWRKLIQWIEAGGKPNSHLKGAWAELAYQIYVQRRSARERIHKLTKELGRTRRAVDYLPDAAVILNQFHEII